MRLSLQTKINQILKNEDYKRIIENILSLFSLQGLTYILPLITFPYLTRILGPENYGLIAFAGAFIGYFGIITDYGFNLSGTREIAINREDNDKISKIFSSIMVTKILLILVSFIIMTLIVFTFEKFRDNWLLYYFTFGLVIGNLLLPFWFFQGIQKMKYISILNIGTTLIFTISIFIFIRTSSDFIYVPLISSLGSITMGIIALRVVRKDFNIKFISPSKEDIKYQLKEGWHVFISTMAINVYTLSNTFILGFFTSNTIVGYYFVADRIIKMASGLIGPISQSIYPYISFLANKSKKDTINFIKKTIFLIGGFSFIISVLIYLFAGLILLILAGNQYNESVLLIQIMAFLPFIIALSNIFGTQTMLNFNYKTAFSHIIIIASAINIILALILAPSFKAVGISVAVVITESFITIIMYLYLKSKGINLF